MTFVSSEGGLWQTSPVKLTFVVALNSFKQIEHMRPGRQGDHLVPPWGMLARSFPPPRGAETNSRGFYIPHVEI